MTSISKQIHDVYTDELLSIIRYTGLLMPLLIIPLGLGAKYGVFDSTYYVSDQVFWLIALAFGLIGIWQFHTTYYGIKMQALNLGLYHLVAVLLILFVIGFNNPALLCWAALAIVSDLLFGRRALALSIFTLVIVAVMHFAKQPILTTDEVLYVLGVIGSVASVAIVMSFLRMVSDNERVAFHKSQRQHVLQRDRLTTLINAMNDAVITTDKKGIIRVYNAATLNLLDTNRTLSGLSVHTVLNLYDENNNPTDLKKVFQSSERTIRRDLQHRYDDGEMINLYISLAPVRPTYHQRQQNGFIVVIRDITKEKSLEEERDEFISVVSHELRTPIAIAEGNLSNIKFLLEHNAGDQSMPAAIDAAHDQVLYLARMINDLSTLSRAERGVADEPEEIDVNPMMEALFNEYRPQAEAKKLSMNLDLHGKIGSVSASRLYLEEVLQNFITNSIKYTQSGSITIGAKKVSNGDVEFYVKDSGIGMSKTDQKKIFEKFYRSEDYRTRETSGTGLGLYVVQKLAHKLRIQIEVKSRLNHGSTFSFTMPLKK